MWLCVVLGMSELLLSVCEMVEVDMFVMCVMLIICMCWCFLFGGMSGVGLVLVLGVVGGRDGGVCDIVLLFYFVWGVVVV